MKAYATNLVAERSVELVRQDLERNGVVRVDERGRIVEPVDVLIPTLHRDHEHGSQILVDLNPVWIFWVVVPVFDCYGECDYTRDYLVSATQDYARPGPGKVSLRVHSRDIPNKTDQRIIVNCIKEFMVDRIHDGRWSSEAEAVAS